MQQDLNKLRYRRRHLIYIVVFTAAMMLIPLVAMQFSDSINWGLLDFVTAALLLIAAGLMGELILMNIKTRSFRLLLIISISIIFVFLWVELAVGVLTNFGS